MQIKLKSLAHEIFNFETYQRLIHYSLSTYFEYFLWNYCERKATWPHYDGILPKGPYPPCLRMADRALLAGYPRIYLSVIKYDRKFHKKSYAIGYQ